MKALIINCSPVRDGATAEIVRIAAEQLSARMETKTICIDDYHFDKLLDPGTNIRFGCWYLNYLSTLFNGDPLCVVCAYHAGQGEIASWLANPLYSSDGLTLNRNSLPEGPTKLYAGRVTRDYGIYKAKYFDQDGPVPAPGDPAAAE